jgi:hypothetical protein
MAGDAIIDKDKNTITYDPQKIISDQNFGNIQNYQHTTSILSDIEFDNGTISFSVKFENQAGACQLVFKINDNEYVYAGIIPGFSPYGIIKGSNNGIYEPLSIAGSRSTIDCDKPVNIEIKKNNALLSVYINRVKAAETIVELRKPQIGILFQGKCKMIVTELKVDKSQRNTFVVMQFTDEYNELYKEVIEPICKSNGFECIRADNFFTPTPILYDIINSIKNSSVIIAEISSSNPNVFYEIGYSHAINKPTILLCDRSKNERLPFDISSFRTLFYENSIGGKTRVEETLKKYLNELA